MKIHLVCFATPNFYKSQRKLIKSALKFGVNYYYIYTFDTIQQTEFYNENKAILSFPKGAGYCLWKPYIILEILKKIPDEDVLIYIDSGIEVIEPLEPLINLAEKQPIVLFQVHNHFNRMWTKRDAFVLMDCDSDHFYNKEQVNGAIQIFKSGKQAISFVSDWLFFAKNINIISDLPNIMGSPNLLEFQENRYDQSILTNLAIKENIRIYRDPSQFGNNYKTNERFNNLEYGQILNHHRNNPLAFRKIWHIRLKRVAKRFFPD